MKQTDRFYLYVSTHACYDPAKTTTPLSGVMFKATVFKPLFTTDEMISSGSDIP